MCPPAWLFATTTPYPLLTKEGRQPASSCPSPVILRSPAVWDDEGSLQFVGVLDA
jgi:hypothetical protein